MFDHSAVFLGEQQVFLPAGLFDHPDSEHFRLSV
jgi:hypothetical protein